MEEMKVFVGSIIVDYCAGRIERDVAIGKMQQGFAFLDTRTAHSIAEHIISRYDNERS
jgi:ABC-type amino acid transport system permease subunit